MPDLLEGTAPAAVDALRDTGRALDLCRADPRHLTYRADEPDEAPLGTLVGEFSMFDQWYEINSYWEGHFIERTAPGAFKRTINNRSDQSPVRVLLEHGYDPTVADKPLGVPRILEERPTGPYAETPLFDTSYNRDLAPALAAGAYGQSFRFRVMADEWVEAGADGWIDTGVAAWAELPQRTITEVRLMEFGPTVWPASPGTNETTGLRSTTDHFYEQLARRDHAAYELAARSVRSLRAAPATAPAPKAPAPVPPPKDSHETQPPAASAPASRHGHAKDPQPITHSEKTTPTQKEGTMPMLNLDERRSRIDEITQRMTEINTEAGVDELRSEVQAEWDQIETELAEHERAIEAYEARQAKLQRFAAKGDAAVDAPRERNGERTPAVHVKPDNIYDLNALRTKARSIDDHARLLRENAMRAVDQARFGKGVAKGDAQEQVRNLLDTVDDEHGTLARRVLTTGSPTYERAFGKVATSGNTHGLDTDEQRAMAMGVDANGGFAVPFQLDPTLILTSDGVDDPIRQIARVEQITGKEWQGVTSAGVTATRSSEGDEAGDNSPTEDQPTVKTSRVDAFIPFSVELELAWTALRSELTMLLWDAKATEEATAFITGDNVAPNPQGVLTGATTAHTAASATALTVNDLYGIKNALGPRFRRNASWLASSAFYDVVRSLAPDDDVWAELAGDINPRLLSKPTYEESGMPPFALTASAKNAILGDFSKFLIVDRVGMNIELIPQVFGANQRPTGQRGLFAWWHNGSKVLVPNAFRVLTMAAV